MILSVEELRKLKAASRYSYREIAEKSGVPLGTVQKVLGGITSSPRRDTMEALTKALLYEGKVDSGKPVSYKEAIGKGIKHEESRKVNEAEYRYGSTDHQHDDMVERLLDSKRAGDFTVEDYYIISEKYRVELIDGEIYDLAAPKFSHQHIAGMVYYQMMNFKMNTHESCMPAIAPLDVQLDCDDKTMVQPDLIVICDRKKNLENKIYGAPDFVMEVFSPTTRFRDRVKKRDKYCAAGCREYWMVDPLNERVTVLDFDGGHDGVYTFDSKIPVRISGGRCQVDFSQIKADLDEFSSLD